MTTLSLSPLEQIDLTSGQPLIALLSVTYGDLQSGVRAIEVQGIALQVGSLNVTVSSSTANTTVAAVSPQNGHFSASMSRGFAGPHGYVIIEAREAQPVAGAAAGFDRCVA